MPRNPRSPIEYTPDPHKRSKEKIASLLELLLQFNYSTRKIIVKRLGLNTDSHHTYFKKLEAKGILQKERVYSISSRHIYMLTKTGKELAAEMSPQMVLDYDTDSFKINHSNIRHNLAVQNAIVDRLYAYDSFTAEKFLNSVKFFNTKRPDACLEKSDKKTMLEVELTAKTDKRIFRALIGHAEGLLNSVYDEVIYIFPSETLKNYYKERFNQEIWPKYYQNERGAWVKGSEYFQKNSYSHLGFEEKFSFIADPSIVNDL